MSRCKFPTVYHVYDRGIHGMSNTSSAPLWYIMIKNVLISAVAGTLFGCLLFPWFGAILQATGRDNYAPFNVKFLLLSTLTSPLLIFYIIPILLPLIITACLAGVLFQKSIKKHLEIWCFISPIFVWIASITILIQKPQNAYYEQFTKFERFLINIPNPDHLLFLIAPAFSAFVFYILSKRALK